MEVCLVEIDSHDKFESEVDDHKTILAISQRRLQPMEEGQGKQRDRHAVGNGHGLSLIHI